MFASQRAGWLSALPSYRKGKRMSVEMGFVFTLIAFVIIGGMLRVSLVDIRRRVRKLEWIDAKLDRLLKEAGIEFDPHKDLPREVLDAVKSGKTITAVRLYRSASGASLGEAMEFVKECRNRQISGDRDDAARTRS
jgi:hypothetical protein